MRYKKSFKQLALAAVSSLMIGVLVGAVTGRWIWGFTAFIVTLLIALSPESFG